MSTDAKGDGFTPGPWYWNAGRHTGPAPRREPRTLCSRTAKSRVDGTDEHVLVVGAKVTAAQAAAITNIEIEIHAMDADERLIAAAPALYAACKAARNMIAPIEDPSDEVGHRVLGLLNAALTLATEGAKAEGGGV